MPVKAVSDVHIRLKLSKLTATNVQTIAVLTSGIDSSVHNYVYGMNDDVSKDFDENTNVYKLVQKAFEVTDYQGVVQVIAAPNNDVPTDVKPKNDGNVTSNNTNKYVYALMQHIDDGFYYVVTDNLAEKDLEAVSDYLYKTQSAVLIAQVKTNEDYDAITNYSAKNQPQTDTKLNGVFPLVETEGHWPNIQTAASATANAPIALIKVGNESEFVPSDSLSVEDIEHIQANGGACVVNKADDMMLSSDKTPGGNYVDQFVNTKIVKDTFQYDLQKQLNAAKHLHFDDNGINLLYQTLKFTSTKLVNQGYLDGEADITKKSYTDTSDGEKATRTYNGLQINAKVMSTIESVNITLDLTE